MERRRAGDARGRAAQGQRPEISAGRCAGSLVLRNMFRPHLGPRVDTTPHRQPAHLAHSGLIRPEAITVPKETLESNFLGPILAHGLLRPVTPGKSLAIPEPQLPPLYNEHGLGSDVTWLS